MKTPEATRNSEQLGPCPRCTHAMVADAYPDIFSGYCSNCGYRARIGGDIVTGTAPANDVEWRRAHGFPE